MNSYLKFLKGLGKKTKYTITINKECTTSKWISINYDRKILTEKERKIESQFTKKYAEKQNQSQKHNKDGKNKYEIKQIKNTSFKRKLTFLY